MDLSAAAAVAVAAAVGEQHSAVIGVHSGRFVPDYEKVAAVAAADVDVVDSSHRRLEQTAHLKHSWEEHQN